MGLSNKLKLAVKSKFETGGKEYEKINTHNHVNHDAPYQYCQCREDQIQRQPV